MLKVRTLWLVTPQARRVPELAATRVLAT